MQNHSILQPSEAPYNHTYCDTFRIEADQFPDIDERVVPGGGIDVGDFLAISVHGVARDGAGGRRAEHRLPGDEQSAVLRSRFHLRHRTNHHQ